MNPNTFDLPPDLWILLETVLPKDEARPQGGRPRVENYRIVCGILYRLRTGCQWQALPERFGSRATVHRRFQQWVEAGIFEKMHHICLRFYDDLEGIDFDWASIDGSQTKAPRGGTDTGANPTDRAKSGSKRSIVTDGQGIVCGVAIAGANVHDNKLVEETLDSVPIDEDGAPQRPKNLCMDKGYAGPKTKCRVEDRNIKPHVRLPGEPPIQGFPKSKKRRWVVERTNSWHNTWRGLKTRWERKGVNYRACVLLASACIAWQSTAPNLCGVF
jgi:putative transposase